MQLKTRFLLVVAAATVTVATTVVVTSRTTVGHIEQQSRTRTIHAVRTLWQSLVDDRRDAMDQVLTDFTRDRLALDALAQGRTRVVREKFITTFRRLQALGVIDALLMTDASGEPVFAVPGAELRAGLARRTLEEGRILYDLATDPQGRLLTTVAMPVYRGAGRRAGAVVLGRRATPILQALAQRTGGEVLRLREDGEIAFSTRDDLGTVLAAVVDGKRAATLDSVAVDDRQWQVVGLPLRDGSGRRLGGLVSAVDRTAVLARNARLRNRAVLVNMLVLLAALVFLYLYMNRAFSRDVADLRQMQALLETRVSDRTAALEQANRRLEQEIGERREAEGRVRQLAFNDVVTGLPNRARTQEYLGEVTAEASGPFALLLLDLDHFREVNDTLGHAIGDRLLVAVTERLQRLLAADTFIARIGGDEFVVIAEVATEEEARVLARQMATELEPPLIINDLSLDVRASIGVAFFPEHGRDGDTLLQRADIAMYHAKDTREGVAIYAPTFDLTDPKRLSLASELRQAIGRDELELFFQPQLDLAADRLLGFEALVRWHHPEHGLLGPDRFIPIAEQTGLIKPLTQWVLNAALRQLGAWCEAGLDVRLSVNLSPRNLHDRSLVDRIEQLLEGWNVPPERLVLEVTESAILHDPERAFRLLTQLHDDGIGLSIDDFGTGYSSLSYLKRLPVTELKVDKSFVIDMQTEASNVVIVRSVIDLAHNLGVHVAGEGIEDRQTLEALAAMGCDTGQGYFIGRPLPASRLEEWLAVSPWTARRAGPAG